jgi:hypothetical protein
MMLSSDSADDMNFLSAEQTLHVKEDVGGVS